MGIATLLVIVAFVFFVFGMFHVFGRYFMTYRLSDTHLRIIGVFAFVSIAYKDITDIAVVPPGTLWRVLLSFDMLRLGNRLWGRAVLIKRRSGLFRQLIITPDSADEFVAQIKTRMGDKNNYAAC